jgi:hypothetical protein
MMGLAEEIIVVGKWIYFLHTLHAPTCVFEP